jgi:hypothetical protein
MSRHHRRSFTEMRRARLAMKWDRLDKLEIKNTITEPISVLGLSVSALRGLAQLGIMPADGGNGALLGRALQAKAASQGPVRADKAPAAPADSLPIGMVASDGEKSAAGGGGAVRTQP